MGGKGVTTVSLPGWTDDELLDELGAALREAPADDSIVRAAQASFTWRTVDADLELLYLDAGAELADVALVRGGAGPGAPRTMAFHGERLSVEIEIDEAGIVGQLSPPQPGHVTLVTAEGPQATVEADEVGCFTFPPPPSGSLRLDCQDGCRPFHYRVGDRVAGRRTPAGLFCLPAVLRLQVVVHELDGGGALTYRRGDPLDGPVPHVPGREHAGHAGFEQQRRPLKRPAAPVAARPGAGPGR